MLSNNVLIAFILAVCFGNSESNFCESRVCETDQIVARTLRLYQAEVVPILVITGDTNPMTEECEATRNFMNTHYRHLIVVKSTGDQCPHTNEALNEDQNKNKYPKLYMMKNGHVVKSKVLTKFNQSCLNTLKQYVDGYTHSRNSTLLYERIEGKLGLTDHPETVMETRVGFPVIYHKGGFTTVNETANPLGFPGTVNPPYTMINPIYYYPGQSSGQSSGQPGRQTNTQTAIPMLVNYPNIYMTSPMVYYSNIPMPRPTASQQTLQYQPTRPTQPIRQPAPTSPTRPAELDLLGSMERRMGGENSSGGSPRTLSQTRGLERFRDSPDREDPAKRRRTGPSS